MALLKNKKKQEEKGPTVVLANSVNGIIPEVVGFDQKTLMDIDVMLDGKLVDIKRVITETKDGTEIYNLGLVFEDRKILVPISRGFADEVAEDKTALLDGRFYVANKMHPTNDKEGEYPYTGPKYISFGKIGTITITDEDSLVEAEATADAKED